MLGMTWCLASHSSNIWTNALGIGIIVRVTDCSRELARSYALMEVVRKSCSMGGYSGVTYCTDNRSHHCRDLQHHCHVPGALQRDAFLGEVQIGTFALYCGQKLTSMSVGRSIAQTLCVCIKGEKGGLGLFLKKPLVHQCPTVAFMDGF
eukprot:4745977-Amphidinium_carterae.1